MTMGRVTKVTPTKVTKETKVITEATKTKVTKVTKVTKETKIILTAATKTKVLVTRVLVGVTKGKIPVGEGTIHPRGDLTRLPTQRDKIKVQMIMMLIHLTCETYRMLRRSFPMSIHLQHLFTMNICMTLPLSPLTT